MTAIAEADVPVNAAVVIRFSEPMRGDVAGLLGANSITTDTVKLLRDGIPVAGTVSLSQDRLAVTFRPAANLFTVTEFTVQVDGVPRLSCITLAHAVEGEVTTIEGLRDHPLVDAFVRADAVQCGFCTPGQVVSAAALVAAIPEPTREEIRHAMAGNICRCGTYPKIEEAILSWQG